MAAFDLSAVLSVAPHLRVVAFANRRWVALVGECEHFTCRRLRSRPFGTALDGLTDVDGVVAAVADRVKPARSLSILQQLCEKGCCAPSRGDRGEQAFLSGLGLGTGPAVALHTIAADSAGPVLLTRRQRPKPSPYRHCRRRACASMRRHRR